MNFLLILACIFSIVLANCEDENTCFCPNITLEHYESFGGFYHSDKPDGRLFYTEGTGCTRNLTCKLSFDTYLVTEWEATDIPRPTDSEEMGGIRIHAQNPGNEDSESYDDLQELFGIVCEDFKWMITKYPYGYVYMSKETMEDIHIDASEVANKSYKTELKKFYCDGEAQDIDYFQQL